MVTSAEHTEETGEMNGYGSKPRDEDKRQVGELRAKVLIARRSTQAPWLHVPAQHHIQLVL